MVTYIPTTSSTLLSGIYIPASKDSLLMNDGTNWVGINLTGDATVSASITINTGAVTGVKIQAKTVSNDRLYTTARGSIKVGDPTSSVVDLPVGKTGQFLMSNGTDLVYNSLSGDILSVSGTGLVTCNNTPIIPLIVNYTTVVADNGSTYTNDSATTPIIITLCPPSAGLNYRIITVTP